MRRFAPLLLVLLAAESTAQQCDAWYRFDGNLSDATGVNHGEMIGAEGAVATPRFVDGVAGQALAFDGSSVMRAFLDLHPDSCRQFTVTGWLRMDPAVNSPQWVLSTGGGGRPGLRSSATTVVLGGSGNGLWERQGIRDSRAWFFFAGVYDYAAGTFRFHWRNRVQEGRLPEKAGAIDDVVWIGAQNDKLRSAARNGAIDELRFIGRVLDEDEIKTLRDGLPAAFVPVAGDSSTVARMNNGPSVTSNRPGGPIDPVVNAGELADRRNTPPLLPGSLPSQASDDDSSSDIALIDAGSVGRDAIDPGLTPVGGEPGAQAGQQLKDAARPQDSLQPFMTEPLDCEIDSALTLKNRPAAVDYSVDCVVDVTATLTIEPGVVIEFAQGAGLGVFGDGSVNAAGSESLPIVLQGASGLAGSWRGVYVGSGSAGNVLKHVRIDGAGSGYVYCCRDVASLLLEGAGIRLTNVHLRNGAQLGLSIDERTNLVQYNGVRIESHEGYPLSAEWGVLGDLDGTGSDYSGNVQDFVAVATDPLQRPVIMKKLNVPYLMPGKVLDITSALTIEAGVELVVQENGGLGVYDEGSLSATGTAAEPIVWRGRQASPGFWRGIHTQTASSNNSLQHVEIRHAGSGYVYCCNPVAALLVKSGDMTLENSTISESGGCGVYTGREASLVQNGNTLSSNQDGDYCEATAAAEADPGPADTQPGVCMTGSVSVFGGSYPPRGWAYADGALLDVQEYSALYSIIGTTYGGDGQTQFALPNVSAPPISAAIICVNGVYPSRY